MRKVVVFQRVKLFLVMFVVILLLAQGLSSVGAASWSKDKWASCTYGAPQGQSWISWSGYPSYYWQTTKINFYWWNGSSWLLMGGAASGYVFGGSGYAEAYTSVPAHSGSWQMPANWWGNLVSTTEYAFFSCS